MKRIVLLMAALVMAAGLAQPVQAGDLPRLLIMGEDADRDSIPRGSRVFKRVLNQFSNALVDEGFDVLDERARLDDTGNRRRRPMEELVDNARDIGANVVVLFTIYWDMMDKGYAKKITSRVEGRLLDVQAGRRLGNFEFETPNQRRLPNPCKRECVYEAVGKAAATLATDVAAALRDKLANRVDRAGGGMQVEYKLIFDKFNQDEMLEWDGYLEIFSGYISHRPDPGAMNTANHHEIIYKSTIQSAKLKRNLIKASKKMNLNAQVSSSGQTYKIKNNRMAKDRSRRGKKDEW